MPVKDTNPKDSVGVRKAPMSLVPARVLVEIGIGMLEGGLKYGRYNYRAVGVRASVYYDATLRHLMSYWEGEDIDPESQMSHITKAITSLVVMRDAMLAGKFEDDRPPMGRIDYPSMNKRASELIDTYSDKKPYQYSIKDEL